MRLGVDVALIDSGLAQALQRGFGRDTGIAVKLIPGTAQALLPALERGEFDAAMTIFECPEPDTAELSVVFGGGNHLRFGTRSAGDGFGQSQLERRSCIDDARESRALGVVVVRGYRNRSEDAKYRDHADRDDQNDHAAADAALRRPHDHRAVGRSAHALRDGQDWRRM